MFQLLRKNILLMGTNIFVLELNKVLIFFKRRLDFVHYNERLKFNNILIELLRIYYLYLFFTLYT